MCDRCQAPPIRLTRRGRTVLMLFLVSATLIVSGLAAQASSRDSDGGTAPVSHQTVVVQPGQTLWSIAREVGSDRDIRSLIHDIEELNGLSSGFLQAGQRLVVPAR